MKTRPFIFVVLLNLFVSPSFAHDAAPLDPVEKSHALTKQEFQKAYEELRTRIAYLRDAKKEAYTRAEKRKIRNEIRDIKREAKQLKEQAGGGIYIGGGALVVIVLLLLLL